MIITKEQMERRLTLAQAAVDLNNLIVKLEVKHQFTIKEVLELLQSEMKNFIGAL